MEAGGPPPHWVGWVCTEARRWGLSQGEEASSGGVLGVLGVWCCLQCQWCHLLVGGGTVLEVKLCVWGESNSSSGCGGLVLAGWLGIKPWIHCNDFVYYCAVCLCVSRQVVCLCCVSCSLLEFLEFVSRWFF